MSIQGIRRALQRIPFWPRQHQSPPRVRRRERARRPLNIRLHPTPELLAMINEECTHRDYGGEYLVTYIDFGPILEQHAPWIIIGALKDMVKTYPEGEVFIILAQRSLSHYDMGAIIDDIEDEIPEGFTGSMLGRNRFIFRKKVTAAS